MRILNILLLLTISSNLLAQSKDSAEWIKLFNAKDLKDWKVKITGHKSGENFGNTFRVKDGKIVVSYDQYQDFKGQFGHIFYKDKFSYYLLSVEYRFVGEQAKGGQSWADLNSGVMIHSQSPDSMELNQEFPICLEVQYLGGDGISEKTTGNLCTPGTNVVMDGKLVTEHCINSKSKTYHGDRWVKADVLVLGDSIIKHIVEGDTVLVYEKPQYGDPNSKNASVDGKLIKEGYISLQSESHPIEFRKVELFNLEKYSKDQVQLNKIIDQLSKRSK